MKPTQLKVTRSSEYKRKAYDLPSTAALIEYLHATAGSPAKQTWVNQGWKLQNLAWVNRR